MPRTKYIIIFFGVLALVLLIAAAYFALRDTDIALGGSNNTALLIQSETQPTVVSVQKNTLREETRAALRAQLAHYVAPPTTTSDDKTEDVDSKVLNTANAEETVEIESSIPTALCDVSHMQTTSLDSWGPVNTILTEGGRSIVSLEQDANGVPKHQLTLPRLPQVGGTEQCPQNDVIGIALDGRVIKMNAPFETDAEGITGYARDGFGIFSKYEDGATLLNTDLDQCHGHIHTIVWNGVPTSMYHYHVTDEAPYTLGCFRGVPASF